MAGIQRWYDLVPEISTARRLSEHHGDKGVRYALCEEHSLIAFNETVRYAIVDLGPRPRVRPHFFDLAGLLRRPKGRPGVESPVCSPRSICLSSASPLLWSDCTQQGVSVSRTIARTRTRVYRLSRRKAS